MTQGQPNIKFDSDIVQWAQNHTLEIEKMRIKVKLSMYQSISPLCYLNLGLDEQKEATLFSDECSDVGMEPS
jgi:hypothetical protein